MFLTKKFGMLLCDMYNDRDEMGHDLSYLDDCLFGIFFLIKFVLNAKKQTSINNNQYKESFNLWLIADEWNILQRKSPLIFGCGLFLRKKTRFMSWQRTFVTLYFFVFGKSLRLILWIIWLEMTSKTFPNMLRCFWNHGARASALWRLFFKKRTNNIFSSRVVPDTH